ncbi:MAG: triose-phosphate isomerase [Coriobacteriales bacterium]|jgi:triosephosphate isomerase|nr:triose-phosphate isomerase [Coriobacteriales bacterium]
MPRKPLVAGNWKMNKTTAQAVTLAQDISNLYDDRLDGVDVVLCPPFTDLKQVSTVLAYDKSRMTLGAQNVCWERSGAYTGEVSPEMLHEIGCLWCIVGHSERRAYFGETDGLTAVKALALLNEGLTPIICVGESLELREQGDQAAEDFVASQVLNSCSGIPGAELSRIVIAYEPIWAIGTGRTATPEQAEASCAAIRAALARNSGPEVAEAIRILYGGSVKPENAALFAPMPDIDGALVGGASLNARDFIDLAKGFIPR